MRCVVRKLGLRPGTAFKTNLKSKLPGNEVKNES